MGPVIGFDLDMTLIDPRLGIRRIMRFLSQATGIHVDGARLAENLGPPLEDALHAHGLSAQQVRTVVDRYRADYLEHVVPETVAMPGAAESLAAVRELGGRVVVVTGKHRPSAALHLAAFGWEVDHLAGGVFGVGKAAVLTEHGVGLYVGDHVADVLGARAAGARAVAVASGPCSAAELAAAGADVVLPDLSGLPALLREMTSPPAAPAR
ncbi:MULTISPECIES: HAD family hydrolase [Actinoalloteichus]|uniref:Phosphatase n=1 Tax=Actinoalloteichus fjordicus TaxID=1612552 RepID=A0AAC9PV08_9PSEU|nr:MULTISPECIES: HAD family hydrolase [Actinoalloteichus]APU17677.1 putative phosphatase [Actinoalloteichus fjordicus]APU23754.1 putative phosphatase [Actinoalloteichus sp. GBA129-24]